MEIVKFNEANLNKLRELYLKVRKSTFTWLNTENYSLLDFDKHTEGEVVYMAVSDGELLGFISIWEPENFIHNLFVSKVNQRQGIGESLLDYVRKLNDRPYRLKCIIENTNAVNFYKKNHFEIESTGEDEVGKYFVMILK
jgi:ribosomal protein S18 acetylase RimI-like enzyme